MSGGVRCEDSVFGPRANSVFTQPFTESVLAVAFVGGKSPRIARRNAGDLLTEVGITPFKRRRTVHVEDSLRFCIDVLRDFERLDTVVSAVAVVSAGTVTFVERGVKSSMVGWIIELCRLVQHSTEARLDSIECLTQCWWHRRLAGLRPISRSIYDNSFRRSLVIR